jgi:hypothetical protein
MFVGTACESRLWLRHSDKTMMRRAMEGWNSGAFCAAVLPTPVDGWGATVDFGAGDYPGDDTLGEPVAKLSKDNSMWMLFSTKYPPIAVYHALASLGFEVEVMWNDVNRGCVGRFTNQGGDENYEYESSSDLKNIPKELVEEFSLDSTLEALEDE